MTTTFMRVGVVLCALAFIICTTTRCAAWSQSVAIKSRGSGERQQCVSWIRASQQCDLCRSRAKTISMSQDSSPLSRAQLLRSVPANVGFVAAAGVVIGVTKPALAALPTPDDYAFGTGSKVKKGAVKDDESVSAVRLSQEQEHPTTPPCATCSLHTRPLPSVSPSNLVEVMGAVSGELGYTQTLVKKQRWGDALERLKTFPLSALKSRTLGLGSVREVAGALRVPTTRAAEILEASMEAGLTLKEAEDIIFSNTRTMQFFNSVDLKQVEAMALETKPPDVTEPLQLLSETKELVDGLKSMMEASP